jgi:hypothetical protein
MFFILRRNLEFGSGEWVMGSRELGSGKLEMESGNGIGGLRPLLGFI